VSPEIERLHAAFLAAKDSLPKLKEARDRAKSAAVLADQAYYAGQELVSDIRIELEMALGFPASDDE
jgi:hypothetical protein